MAGAIVGIATTAPSATETRRIQADAREETIAQGDALRDAGSLGALRNARSAVLGMTVGLKRHGWNVDVLEPAAAVVAAMFSSAAVRLGAAASGADPDSISLVKAHVLKALLGTGILTALAETARLHSRHHPDVAAKVFSVVSLAIMSAISVALSGTPLSTFQSTPDFSGAGSASSALAHSAAPVGAPPTATAVAVTTNSVSEFSPAWQRLRQRRSR